MIGTELIGIIAISGALVAAAKLYLDYSERKDSADRKNQLAIAQIEADSRAERAAIRANARLEGKAAELRALSEVPQQEDPMQALIMQVLSNPQAIGQITALLQGGVTAQQGGSFPAKNQAPLADVGN
jgi:hypothetical protein